MRPGAGEKENPERKPGSDTKGDDRGPFLRGKEGDLAERAKSTHIDEFVRVYRVVFEGLLLFPGVASASGREPGGGRELSLTGEIPPVRLASAPAGPGSPPGWSGWWRGQLGARGWRPAGQREVLAAGRAETVVGVGSKSCLGWSATPGNSRRAVFGVVARRREPDHQIRATSHWLQGRSVTDVVAGELSAELDDEPVVAGLLSGPYCDLRD